MAKRAGVSTATVSHVINNTRFVSEKTRAKVEKTLVELDFHRSKYAKVLASGKTKTIGLLVSDIGNPFFPKIIRHLDKLAKEDNYDILFFDTNYNSKRAEEAGISLLEHGVDGVFLMTTETDFSLVDRLVGKRIPVVLLDWGLTDDYISNVKENFDKGLDEAVSHLVSLGHKDIAFVSGPLQFNTSKIRENGFRTAIQKYPSKLNEPLLIESNFRIEGGETAFYEIIKHRKYTAILSSNDLMALGLFSAARKSGYSVPEDLSIIGVDDIFLSAFLSPPLSTICVPQTEICEKAWELMKRFIIDGDKEGQEIIIDTFLVSRYSTTIPKVNYYEERKYENKIFPI